MTNKEAWLLYMKDVTSPDSFIEMGFYGLIASALQRRVYLGSDERPLFGNQYIILVADAGIGKNLVLGPVSSILKHHKLERFKVPQKQEVDNMSTTEQLDAVQALMAEMTAANNEHLNGQFNRLQKLEEPLLFPIAADALTFEALVRTHARSLRSIFPDKYLDSRLLKSKLYTHASLCFCLEEISSLFRKHTEDVVNYLIKAFDCGEYTYETKNKGTDRVKNSCLNLIAGTTPAFMRETFNDKLLNEGFSSRTVFVYGTESRFYRFDVAKHSAEQIVAKQQLIDFVKKLSILFGPVTYSPEAYEYMKEYVENILGRQRQRINASPKLISYYARKNIHVQKMAMAIHFSESTEMEIQIETVQAAVKLLEGIELNMDKALNIGGRNPLGKTSDRVFKFLQTTGPKTDVEIWTEFIDDITKKELEEVIDYLRISGKVGLMDNKKYIAK